MKITVKLLNPKKVKTDIEKQRKRAEYISKKYELLNKDNGTE